MPLPTTSIPFNLLPTTPFPTPSTILLIQTHLSHHLPPELVDLILNHAEFWAHSTTTTPPNQPVRAFGPFTWGWGRGKGEGEDRIDYLNVWCPAGPGYAHRWRRWGESRRDDGFVMRSGPIGLLEDEEGEGQERGQLRSSRYLLKKKSHRVGRCILSLYQKGTVAAAAGLSRMCHRCQKCSDRETTTTTTTTTMNKIPAPHPSSRRRTAAVRKIIFETWSHQDYFGAVGDDSAADDDDDDDDEESEGEETQHSITPRLFCDVTINRRMMKGRDAQYSTFSCWKGRLRRWRWRRMRIGNVDGISDETDNNDKDASNNCKNNNNTTTTTTTINHNEKSDRRHGKMISHKPFILATTSHPRSYHPTYHINTWRWDSYNSNSNPNPNPITPNTSLKFPTAQEFLRQLEVGDTIGIWGRVGKGETYHIIDAMRMHVFWAL